jgi:hypothetical protein
MPFASRRRFLLSAAGLAVAPGAAAFAGENRAQDRLIVPGERVGPITRSTRFADLVQHFGAENLRRGFASYGTTLRHPATIVFPGRADEIAVMFGENLRTEALCLTKRGGAWQTAEGIRVGTPIADLARLNGRAFTIAGLGCERECGYVKPRKGDRLPDPDRLSLRLAPERPLRPEDYALLAETGGRAGAISSNAPLFRRLNAVVDEAVVFLT